MSTPKTPVSALFASPNRVRERDGRLGNSSGEWIRTTDLRVMSPTSYLCSARIKRSSILLPHFPARPCQRNSGLRVAMYADEAINRQGDQDASVGIVQVAGNALGGLDDLIHHLI